MKKLILTAYCLLLTAFIAWAGAGTTGGSFLLIGGGARPLGMGESYVAMADDSSSVFWNPAGLAWMIFPEVQYMYNQWFVDIKHQYFNLGFPTAQYGTVGGGYSLLDSGDIPGYSSSGSPESTFKAQDSALTLSWARKLNDRLSVGVNLKSISESLENNQAASTALDLGLLFNLNPRLRLGAAVQNVGAPLKFIAENSPLPQTYRLGLAFRQRFIEDNLSLALDYVSSAGSSPSINFGGEYLFRGLLALRAGSSRGALRAGVGLRSGQFGLDYAYLAHNALGAAHQVSMSYSFGSEDRKKALVLDYLALANAYYGRGKVADAIVELNKAYALDPENAEAKAMLARTKQTLEGKAGVKVEEAIEAEKIKEVAGYLANGRKFMAEKEYLDAITEYNKALKIMPSHAETIKLVREAQAALEAEVSAKVRKEAEEHLGLALKNVATGDYSEALKETQKVLEIDPGNVQALKLYKKLKKIVELEKK